MLNSRSRLTPISKRLTDGYSIYRQQFDVVMFVDVLHHTDDPMILLRQAYPLARKAIVDQGSHM